MEEVGKKYIKELRMRVEVNRSTSGRDFLSKITFLRGKKDAWNPGEFETLERQMCKLAQEKDFDCKAVEVENEWAGAFEVTISTATLQGTVDAETGFLQCTKKTLADLKARIEERKRIEGEIQEWIQSTPEPEEF